MNTGDRVEYTYLHSINRRSKVQITKRGTFLRWVRSKTNGNTSNDKAVVKLDGNKGNSVVYSGKITLINN
jgi:hypothetical protein